MNKMLRNIIIMAVVVALAAVALIFSLKLEPKNSETTTEDIEETSPKYIISSYSPEDAQKVTLENDESITVILYDEDIQAYYIEGHEDLALNQNSVKNIFDTASSVEAEDIATEDMGNLAEFGLDKPVSKVTAEYKDGKSNVFLFGNNVPGSGQHYMMKEGEDKVFVVGNRYGNNAKLSLNDLIEIESIGFELEDLSAINVYKNGEIFMGFTNTSNQTLVESSSWKLTLPYYRSVSTAKDDDFYAFAEAILSLSPDEVLDALGENKKYGLDNPWVQVDLKPEEGKTISIFLGTEKDGRYPIKFSDSEIIYDILVDDAKFLDYEPIDVIERLLTLVNIKYISKIEMSGVAGDNTLIVENKEKKDNDGNVILDGNDKPFTEAVYIVDGVALTEEEQEQGAWFYQTIIGVKITREANEDFVPGEPVGAINLVLTEEPFEYLIEFYEYDEYFYAVKFFDNETYLVVNKEDVSEIPAGYELLRNREMERP